MLTAEISIPGVVSVERDAAFDDEKMRNAGIRLYYAARNPVPPGVKEGILLEAGFDLTAPNRPCTITSWALEYAMTHDGTDILDNRARNVACYEPGYTFVEKLQTISTKYRQQQKTGSWPQSFIRHYYDIFCLLQSKDVQTFVGTPEYVRHKMVRFRQQDQSNIEQNEAFLLRDPDIRKQFERAYMTTSSLYYREMPSFSEILDAIQSVANRL